MEPIYSVEVLVPSDKMGDVMSDLQNRRAMIEGMSSDKGFERLVARVPLAEMYRYSTTLSSLTNGRATYSMKSPLTSRCRPMCRRNCEAYADTDKDELTAVASTIPGKSRARLPRFVARAAFGFPAVCTYLASVNG